ncbi:MULTISPECIES: phasin family protein [Janthinobacterium]|uniref:Phasin family protein n=1 Tax=Janthinobacterium violaceinigrum TaxID=2654252 RepID=A0A6I1I1N0_9BURK|nr:MULTISPECIES: phasin family protein [Janthinobacterium]KAB8064672.1 phasin family protein [Janthinobacterium violaceinigrum]MCX7290750.1 phasin family protein [Janthinobacterium sp.]MED5596719.1 phasin family protein [Janthinobacterium sp. P210006]
MYPYSRSVTPAAKNHLEAQLAFFNGLSKSLFQSVQHFNDLNMQLAQGLLEESTVTSQNLLTVERAEDVFQVAAAAGQPAAEQLRKYQQQVSRLAADTQVELANVAERHVNETSRTAKALAEEVARTASEETEKNVRKQQEAMQRIAEPFQAYHQNGANRDQQRGASRDGQSLQSAGQQGSQQSAGSESSVSGSVSQAGSAQSKSSSASRKE